MAHVVQVWRRRRKWRGDGVLPHWGCWKLAGVRNSEGGSGGGGGGHQDDRESSMPKRQKPKPSFKPHRVYAPTVTLPDSFPCEKT